MEVSCHVMQPRSADEDKKELSKRPEIFPEHQNATSFKTLISSLEYVTYFSLFFCYCFKSNACLPHYAIVHLKIQPLISKF